MWSARKALRGITPHTKALCRSARFTSVQPFIPQNDPSETQEWKYSVDSLLESSNPARSGLLLQEVIDHAVTAGVNIAPLVNTPQLNTPIPQCQYPGDVQTEKRIADLNRWNIASMVSLANSDDSGLGGHIATGLAWAEVLECGLNHYWTADDFVFFQGHSSPALYSRSFLEGRFSEERLKLFRRETFSEQGLSSYPHPLLMHDYWNFPTVSMGLGPLNAIALGRYLQYAKHHKILPEKYANSKVWVFVGDGETDTPETLSSIATASREGLDNLIFMIGCNLQRLDSTVRSNGQIIQELEGKFKGVGWNVVKVVHGSQWDQLYAGDTEASLVEKFDSLLDADSQRLTVESADTIRKEMFNNPGMKALVEGMTDEQIISLLQDCGGHDLLKINNAFNAVSNNTTGKPSVILFRTIKGKRGGKIEASNGAHQEKFIKPDDMVALKKSLDIPLTDEEASNYKFIPAPPEIRQYMTEAAQRMGGYRPARVRKEIDYKIVSDNIFEKYMAENKRATSTTLVLGDMLKVMMKDKTLGKTVVPITPDEGRTFGWIGLYGEGIGIYSPIQPTATGVDAKQLMKVTESPKGRIIQEGISEAQGMASMTAFGTSHHTIGVQTIPFFFTYSMFGFQRVHDIIYNGQDAGCRGFLCGATAGGTTLNGEGLQHQDRTSYLVAGTMTNMRAYEPAFAYHLATIVRRGLVEMTEMDMMYYLMIFNENYPQLGCGTELGTAERTLLEDQIMLGAHYLNRLTQEEKDNNKCVRLLGSGPLLPKTLEAQQILKDKYGVLSEVVAVTSYTELERDGTNAARYNRKHPGETPKVAYVEECFGGDEIVTVAHSDWSRKVPLGLKPWIKGEYIVLGTDGCGRSDTRQNLRKFFEIDTGDVVYAALEGLKMPTDTLKSAIADLDLMVDRYDRTSSVEVASRK